MKNKKLYIFDLDGTLINCSSEKLLFKELLKERRISLTDIFYFYLPRLLGKFKLFRLEYFFLKKWGRHYLHGKDKRYLIWLSEKIFKEKILKEINEKILKIIRSLKNPTDKILILSASLDFLIEPIAKYLDIKEYLCSNTAQENNQIIPLGKEKINKLKFYLTKRKISISDYRIIAYANDKIRDKYLLNFADEGYLVTKGNIMGWMG